MTMDEKFEILRRYDTPSITNVIATYPEDHRFCLGLFDPWDVDWYTDETCRCMFPQLERRVGYAVTAVTGLKDPGFNRLTNENVFRAIADSPKPCILVMKQDMPEKYRRKNRAFGGNFTTALKALGCQGVVTDGPIGDVDEIRVMDFQYLATGVTPGHGEQGIKAVNIPVTVCGMEVCPGDIIHMDENGAVRFPASIIDEVIERVQGLNRIETLKMERVRNCIDVQEIIDVTSGKKDQDLL